MRRRTFIILGAAALGLLAVPGSRAGAPPCPAGTERFAEYRLFFGRSRDGVEVVTDAQWHAFLAEEITPRFPDGLTVVDAAGQWRGPSGTIERERTKMLIVLAAPGEEGMRRTDEIAEAYKRTFGQESVLRVVGTACASFQLRFQNSRSAAAMAMKLPLTRTMPVPWIHRAR